MRLLPALLLVTFGCERASDFPDHPPPRVPLPAPVEMRGLPVPDPVPTVSKPSAVPRDAVDALNDAIRAIDREVAILEDTIDCKPRLEALRAIIPQARLLVRHDSTVREALATAQREDDDPHTRYWSAYVYKPLIDGRLGRIVHATGRTTCAAENPTYRSTAQAISDIVRSAQR